MARIQVFEPALCCNTGVCGTDVDQALVDFSADVDFYRTQGIEISRHNLANDPQSFVENPLVMHFLQAAGSEGLPLVLVNDVTVLTGRYPTREMLSRYTHEAVPSRPELSLSAVDTDGCCGGGGCGC
jgi:hypothetical protein